MKNFLINYILKREKFCFIIKNRFSKNPNKKKEDPKETLEITKNRKINKTLFILGKILENFPGNNARSLII